MIRVIQNALPTEDSVIMPNMAEDGNYFITEDYYSHNGRSYLVVRMNEGGLLRRKAMFFCFSKNIYEKNKMV